ncbi:hypothetical protein INS49_004524 [Diaporthe citri]|uniref:uncharacterized protein n=1 Tax=Diaporthe citri TaxID=83186 RepID=UPI001C81854D|nr:uncharacterized protein INS49_004524 [Diaporthe citri]KAG6354507.1 hypothetical protein INS49_004524 [Diaporthe citri]
MPTPGIAEAGFAVGAANALAGVPNNAKTWNAVYHDVVDFLKRVDQARSDLEACAANFREWKDIWKYKSAEWDSCASLFLRSPYHGATADEQRPADNQTPAGDQHPPLNHQTPTDDHRLPQGPWSAGSHQPPSHQPHEIRRKPVAGTAGTPPPAAQGVLPMRNQGPTATQELVTINAENAAGADSNDDSLYKSLWGDQYNQIQDCVHRVVQGIRGIDEHIDRIMNEKKNSPKWRKYLNVHRARFVRNLAYALFSNSALREEIVQLKGNIAGLKEVSEMRLRKMQGNAADLKLTGAKAFQLANLEYFGRKIVQELRGSFPTASAWSLELCHPDIAGSAAEWQDLTSIQLWLSYATPVGQHDKAQQRIILDYSLVDDPNPPQWASALPGANPADNSHRGLAHNPRLTENCQGTGKLTVPFNKLFKIWHDGKSSPAELWARDQAYLVLSLVNWSLLLCTSDWTAKWCSSGLHFVRAATDVGRAGNNSFFFPSFSGCASKAPGTTVNQRQHHRHDCCHSSLKLCNLGLVLAEAICIIPLRVCTTRKDPYEKCIGRDWIPLSEDALLDLVEKTSRSKGVRHAVQKCLRSPTTLQIAENKLAGSFEEYVKMVFDP